MNLLAVDTSCSVATVAVMADDKLTAHYYIDNKLTHSTMLMPMIDEMLKKAELTADDIDVFAAGIGPGSFTGLRIGIATIKGFACALNKPACGICSLEATAYNFALCEKDICIITDARNGQAFCAVYKSTGETLETLMEPCVINVSELADEISVPTIIAGDAAIKYEKLFSENKNIIISPPHLRMPQASSLGFAAVQAAKNGKLLDPAQLTAMYMRKSQAEREKEMKNQTEGLL